MHFCCSCLVEPFFPARTTEALICCGCLHCKIWTSWTVGHGAGWHLLSYTWSLLYMSSASMRGVIWCRMASRGAIQHGTCVGFIEYHTLLWTPCGRSWLRRWCPSSSCPSLRGGYCWTAVGHTSSWLIPGHQQHQSQSGQCNGASWCIS